MTDQEILDRVYPHLLTQRRKSLRKIGFDDEGCAYRGEDGCSCAIGCLIPDDMYDPEIEGCGIDINFYLYGYVLFESQERMAWIEYRLGLLDSLPLLSLLQTVHDGYSVNEWESRLRSVADEFGLTVPEIAK